MIGCRTKPIRNRHILLALLLVAVTTSGCGGGGGGGAAVQQGLNTPRPADAVASFASALKTNNQNAAAALFADETKEKSLRNWQSLSAAEKTFVSRAIEDSVTVPPVSPDQTVLRVYITVRDSAGNLIRTPLVLVKGDDENWRIRSW